MWSVVAKEKGKFCILKNLNRPMLNEIAQLEKDKSYKISDFFFKLNSMRQRIDWCLPAAEWQWAKWVKKYKSTNLQLKNKEILAYNVQHDDHSSKYYIFESC